MFRNYRNYNCMKMQNDSNCQNNMFETQCNNVYSCENDSNICDCGFDDNNFNPFPENPILGQSYVPLQQMDRTFKPCIGLQMGTIFPELVSKYNPGQSMEEICYLRQSNAIGKGCNICRN